MAYGKMFVDFNAMLRGTLDDLRMFGRLKVLGDTELTYVLTDSPLSVEDELADLVEFVDFADSTRVLSDENPRPMNMNLTMNVSIDNAAQIHCLLSPDATSYVDLEGGGDLTLTYSPQKDLQLNGRYTINSGTLKYTMMIIPLKEFTIKNGSYVEFHGPLMNPTLSLSATERLRTTITENDHPRSVNFDVGMNITQTLENLGLEFTLDAPDDLSLQTELLTMSAEQRGRVAVTMLATGMYFNENGSNGMTGQNALNAFLQSQISNITGKALKSVDLSFGVEQGTNATGATQTDYRNLPPAYTFVGTGEPFYQETMDYIDNLNKAGVEAKADVYVSNIHAFDMLYPNTPIAQTAIQRFEEHFAYAVENYLA